MPKGMKWYKRKDKQEDLDRQAWLRHGRRSYHFSRFLNSYISAAMFSSTDEDGEPLDNSYHAWDIDTDAQAVMQRDAFDFFKANEELISEDYQRAGSDFWFTRNGHGAGFWDGDWGTLGDRLTELSHAYGEYNLYEGDDGMIHGSGG